MPEKYEQLRFSVSENDEFTKKSNHFYHATNLNFLARYARVDFLEKAIKHEKLNINEEEQRHILNGVFSKTKKSDVKEVLRKHSSINEAVISKMTEDHLYPSYTSTDNIASKPVIYLYPESGTFCEITVKIDGFLTVLYPAYNLRINNSEKKWSMYVHSDGTIEDTKNGNLYPYLYWAGIYNKKIQIKEGSVVAGEKTASFLEKKLRLLGLNYRERADMITYWLSKLASNPWNLIYFARDEYFDQVSLEVIPVPDTSIRIMMIVKPLSEKIDIPEQEFPEIPPNRDGFTLVEWGGTIQSEYEVSTTE